MLPEDQNDRRKYKRIKKSFLLRYYDLADSDNKYEATQIRNISLGGMCFITQKAFAPSSKLGMELKTPFQAENTHLEGVVLESHERIKGVIYETRVQFTQLSPRSEFVLQEIITYLGEEIGP